MGRGQQDKKLKAKRVLKDLREHEDDIRKNRETIENPRKDALAAEFVKAESNMKKAENVDQKVVDAKILRELTKITKKQAAQMQTGLKDYDVASFVDKLAMIMKEEAEVEEEDDEDAPVAEGFLDLMSLGTNLVGLFATFPSTNFIHGNSDFEPKAKKARVAPRKKKDKEPVAKPAEVLAADAVETTETDREVKAMMKQLKKHKHMNFWKFIVDPENYGRTIENGFHASFLVKDGKAKIDFNSEPYTITLREQRGGDEDADQAKANDEEENAVNSQYILKLDYMTWKRVTEQYNITECLLPSANKSIANGNGAPVVPKEEDEAEDDDGDDDI